MMTTSCGVQNHYVHVYAKPRLSHLVSGRQGVQ